MVGGVAPFLLRLSAHARRAHGCRGLCYRKLGQKRGHLAFALRVQGGPFRRDVGHYGGGLAGRKNAIRPRCRCHRERGQPTSCDCVPVGLFCDALPWAASQAVNDSDPS